VAPHARRKGGRRRTAPGLRRRGSARRDLQLPRVTVCGKAIGCTGAGSVRYQRYQSPATSRTEAPKYPKAAMATERLLQHLSRMGRISVPAPRLLSALDLRQQVRRPRRPPPHPWMAGFGIAGGKGSPDRVPDELFQLFEVPLILRHDLVQRGPTTLASNRWQAEQTASNTFIPFSSAAASPPAGIEAAFPSFQPARPRSAGGAESPWKALATAVW